MYYIYEYGRIPFQKYNTYYKDYTVLDLATYILKKINIKNIKYISFGCTRMAGYGPAILQQLLNKNHLKHMFGFLINNACATGIYTLLDVYLKNIDHALSLCSESMTNANNILINNELISNNYIDGFLCPQYQKTMLDFAIQYNLIKTKYQKKIYTKKELDKYTLNEYIKHKNAYNDLYFQKSIIPFNNNIFENISLSDINISYFEKAKILNNNLTNKTVCSLSDGAAYLKCGKNKSKAIVQIKDYMYINIEPKYTVLSSIVLMKKILKKYSLTVFDIIEFHDAFANMGLNFLDMFNNIKNYNIYGSTISSRHPISVTGLRLISNAITSLISLDKTLALIITPSSIGHAIAIIIERI